MVKPVVIYEGPIIYGLSQLQKENKKNTTGKRKIAKECIDDDGVIYSING